MLNFFRFSAFSLFLFSTNTAFSQKLEVPFGTISKLDLEMLVYKSDPGADAVILSDCGSANLDLGSENFEILMIRDVQIKIINKNGFDYANIEIPYSVSDKVIHVEASTFNLEKGSIVETKIPKKAFFIDKANKYKQVLRIAFPNVREGSIIEYRYQYSTSFIHEFIPWNFQSEVPVRYSEFTASYPNYFKYRGVIKGDLTSITRNSDTKDIFFGEYRTNESINKWVGRNIPAFREEPYITGKNDHLTKLEFELEGVDFPSSSYKEITPTYKSLSEKLIERKDFGLALNNASFLEKYTKRIISGATSDLQKLKMIHQFVSQKFLYNGREDYTVTGSLRKVFNKESGNSAEINLLLIAMLRKAGLTADPVILSTRSNGSLHPTIAMIQKFNYVIAMVSIGGKNYFVDATEPLLPFNTLPFECLTDKGRIIHPSISEWVKPSNNEKNISNTLVNFSISENGDIKGNIVNSYSNYLAFLRRKFIKLESLDGYKDNLRTAFANWDINNFNIQNLESIDNVFIESFDFKTAYSAQKTSMGLIINPNIYSEEKSNPFSSEERKYPINFGCPLSTTYSINIIIPEGYTVVDKPSNISLKLPENGGGFIFNCTENGNNIVIQSKFYIDQIYFNPDDYRTLREFYAQAYHKYSELIVLKKKM